MTFQDAVTLSATETKVVIGIFTVISGAALWLFQLLVRVAIKMWRQVQKFDVALFGDPKALNPNGIIRKFNAHCDAEEVWKTRAIELSTKRHDEAMQMLKQIEEQLPERRRKQK